MHFRNLLTSAALLAAAFLTACQTTQGMNVQTMAYNEAVSDSTNQFFVVSALRARDRLPVYYTHTTGNSAAASVTPSLTLAMASGTLNPSATFSGTAGNTVSLVNLDDQKSMRGVLTPLPAGIMESYFGQGWPPELLAMMFVKSITIDKKLAIELNALFDKRCAARGQKSAYCANARPKDSDGIPVLSPSIEFSQCITNSNYASGRSNAFFDNYPPDHSQRACFQAAIRVLLGLGFVPADGTKYSVVVPRMAAKDTENLRGIAEANTAKLSVSPIDSKNTKTGASPTHYYAVCTKKDVSGFTLDEDVLTPDEDKAASKPAHRNSKKLKPRAATPPLSADETDVTQIASSLQALLADLPSQTAEPSSPGGGSLIPALSPTCADQAQFDQDKKAKKARCKGKGDPKPAECADTPTFDVTTRSLDSMIYYLGEGLRGSNEIEVWIRDGDHFAEAPLFVVKPGDQHFDGYVRTRYDGRDWIIPHCRDDSICPPIGRSLQVLSLLNQVWGLQKEASDQPTVPVVSVINSH